MPSIAFRDANKTSIAAAMSLRTIRLSSDSGATGVSSRRFQGSRRLQLRRDPVHTEIDVEILGLARPVSQIRGIRAGVDAHDRSVGEVDE